MGSEQMPLRVRPESPNADLQDADMQAIRLRASLALAANWEPNEEPTDAVRASGLYVERGSRR